MSKEFFMICERLLSATANGLYQGMIIALVVGLALRLCTRTNAATRYAIWFGTLLLIAALIPAHVFVSFDPHWQLHEKSVEEVAASPVVIPRPSGPVNVIGWQIPDYSSAPVQPRAIDPETIAAAPLEETADEPTVFERTVDTTSTENVSFSPPPTVLKPFSTKAETFVNLPHWVCIGLISAWVILASLRFAVIAMRLAEVRRIKKSSVSPSAGLQAIFDKLRGSRPERREVRLRISSAHRTAVVLGFAHPAVLLPSEMDKDANDGEVAHVLRHELAHVDRWDDWGNLAQQVIEGALHFHPAIWWISRQLSLEREIACDDQVIEASGRARAYALTLANVAIRMNQSRHSLSPGVSNNNSQLQQRITMILNAHRDRSPRMARSRLGLFTATAAILAAIAISVGPRLVLAESASAEIAEASPDLSGPDTAPRIKSGSSESADIAPPAPEVVEAPDAPEPPEPPEAPEAPEPSPAPSALAAPQVLISGGSALVTPMTPRPPMTSVAPMVVSRSGIVTEVSMDSDEAPQAKHGRHQKSIEERLDRLERKLDEMQARGDRRGRQSRDEDAFALKQGNQNWNGPDGKPADFNFKFDYDFKNTKEQIQRAAEQAQRAAEAGQREAERAMRDMERESGKKFAEMQEKFRGMRTQFDGSETELQALKQAKQSLDREVEKLNEQIKHLEDQKNREPKPKHVHKDDGDDSGDKEGK